MQSRRISKTTRSNAEEQRDDSRETSNAKRNPQFNKQKIGGEIRELTRRENLDPKSQNGEEDLSAGRKEIGENPKNRRRERD